MKDDMRRTQVISVEEILIMMWQDCQAVRKKEKRFSTGETQIEDKECVLQSLGHMSLSCIRESCMVQLLAYYKNIYNLHHIFY